jgi:hypothetical protein
LKRVSDSTLAEGGTCRIDDPDMPVVGVMLYEHEQAQGYREYRQAEKAAQTAERQRRSGIAA